MLAACMPYRLPQLSFDTNVACFFRSPPRMPSSNTRDTGKKREGTETQSETTTRVREGERRRERERERVREVLGRLACWGCRLAVWWGSWLAGGLSGWVACRARGWLADCRSGWPGGWLAGELAPRCCLHVCLLGWLLACLPAPPPLYPVAHWRVCRPIFFRTFPPRTAFECVRETGKR